MRSALLILFSALTTLVCVVGGSSAFATSSNVTFYFYGAVDCAPCMAFKKTHLPDVLAEAEQSGFGVSVNIIDRTADIKTEGVYGDNDAILRRAATKLPVVYPPIFFVAQGSEILTAYRSDWKAALADAQRAVNESQ